MSRSADAAPTASSRRWALRKSASASRIPFQCAPASPLIHAPEQIRLPRRDDRQLLAQRHELGVRERRLVVGEHPRGQVLREAPVLRGVVRQAALLPAAVHAAALAAAHHELPAGLAAPRLGSASLALFAHGYGISFAAWHRPDHLACRTKPQSAVTPCGLSLLSGWRSGGHARLRQAGSDRLREVGDLLAQLAVVAPGDDAVDLTQEVLPPSPSRSGSARRPAGHRATESSCSCTAQPRRSHWRQISIRSDSSIIVSFATRGLAAASSPRWSGRARWQPPP